MARSLVSVSFFLRNILTSSKYVAASRLYHSSHEAKELDTNDISDTKQLFAKLQEDNNPLNLITIIEANRQKIDARHVVIALTSMQKFYENSGLPLSMVHQSIQFINMCSILRRHLNKLDIQQTIQAIKVLKKLNVSSSSVIMQSLLQLIRASCNNLSLSEIFLLTFLLKTMPSTPLSASLFKALPKVFSAQLELQLDTNNIKELKQAFAYADFNKLDSNCTEYIIDALNKYQKGIDVDSAISIYNCICFLKNLSDNCLKLKNRIENILLNDIDMIDSSKIYKILLQISVKSATAQSKFYNPVLLDTFIKKWITTNPDVSQALSIIRRLNKCRHINISLLDYLSSLITAQPTILSQCGPYEAANFVASMAFANYKPSSWQEIQNIVADNYKTIPDDVTLAYFTINLLSLDYFHEKSISYIFASDIDPKLINSGYYQVLQQLYQSVKILYPTYTGPWPSKKLVNTFTTFSFKDPSRNSLLLTNAIKNIVVDPALLQSNVKTSLGHTIDHLIILQDGRPIAIRSQSTSEVSSTVPFVDDFEIPPDAERVAVLEIPQFMHGSNIPIMQSTVHLNIKVLEAMSFKVVPVSLPKWLDLPDCEKLPYLNRLIGIRTV